MTESRSSMNPCGQYHHNQHDKRRLDERVEETSQPLLSGPDRLLVERHKGCYEAVGWLHYGFVASFRSNYLSISPVQKSPVRPSARDQTQNFPEQFPRYGVFSNVRSWHRTDLAAHSTHIRYWGQSRREADITGWQFLTQSGLCRA